MRLPRTPVRMKHVSALLLILLLGGRAGAQLTGTLTVPGTYATLAAAVADLNLQGVGAGGATLLVTDPQTAPTGGYLLGSAVLNGSTSATSPLLVNGGGTTITSYTGTGLLLDGVFNIAGTDWVTIDSLNIAESTSNTTVTTQMEWGYGLLKRVAGTTPDGCQHVTIKNCSITLRRTNTNSRGIYTAAHLAGSSTTYSVTTAADAHNNNRFQNNSIQNVATGISLNGASTPATLYDSANVVIGNTVQNYGGGAGTAYGVYLIYQHHAEVRNNVLNNSAGGGVAGANTLYGIFHSTGTASSFLARGNTITLAQGSVTSSAFGINSAASGAAAVLNIDSNTVTGSMAGSTGVWHGIYASGTVQSATFKQNVVSSITHGGTGTMYGLWCANGVSPGGSLAITGNRIRGVTRTGASGVTYGLYTSGPVASTANYAADSNRIDSIIHTTTSSGAVYALYDDCGTTPFPQKTFNADTITNLRTGSGLIYALYTTDIGGTTAGPSAIEDTRIETLTSAGSQYGINLAGAAAAMNIERTSVSGLTSTSTTAAVYGLNITGGTVNVDAMRINDVQSGITTTSALYGMYAAGGTTLNFTNNLIYDLRTPAASSVSPVYGLFLAGGSTVRAYHNTVSLSGTSTGANFGATGVYYAAAVGTLDLRNNIIRVAVTPTGTGFTVALRRSTGTAGTVSPELTTTTNANIYYAPAAAAAHYYGEGTTAAGLVNVFNATNDPNFSNSCALYKAFMSPRESFSSTEDNLAPSGTVGLAPSGASRAQNAGVATTTPAVTTDYFGTTRSATPDIGAVEFTGTQIDVVAPTVAYTPLPTPAYCAAPPTLAAAITDAVGVSTATGTAPRLYYKKQTEANAFGANTNTVSGWKWVEGTGTAPAFSFTPDYSLLTAAVVPGDSIQYFVVAQDAAGNVGYNMAGLPAGFCPGSVALPAAAAPLAAAPAVNGYLVSALPAFLPSASVPAVCGSGTVVLSLSPATASVGVEWQADTGTGYFAIPGATTNPYTATLSTTTTYRARILCNGVLAALTSTVTVNALKPEVASTTPASRCGPGTVVLSATATPTGATLSWFDAPAGGAPTGVGTPFTTPTLPATDTFYAAASQPASGPLSLSTLTGGTTAAVGGVMFNLTPTTTVMIDSFTALFNAGGTQTVNVYYKTGTYVGSETSPAAWTLLGSTTVSATAGSASTVAVGNALVLSPGTAYGIYLQYNARTTAASAVLSTPDLAINTGAGLSGTFTGATSARTFNSTVHYRRACEGSRVPVVATVNPAPAVTVTSTPSPGVCAGGTATLTAASANPGYVYTWSTGTSGPMETVTPAVTTTYSVTAVDAAAGCTLTAPYTVPVNTSPPAPLLSPAADTICPGEVAVIVSTLVPAGAGVPYVNRWTVLAGLYKDAALTVPMTAADTVTTAYASPLSTTVYTAVADRLGCLSAPSNTATIEVTPLPLGVTASGSTALCPGGSVTLSATSAAGLSYQWLNAGLPVGGATGASYTTSAAGSYAVQVSNGVCVDTSAPVAVTSIAAPPATTTPAGPQTLCAGQTLTLSAPSGPYTYQWAVGGTAIGGATAATYGATAAGSYTVTVSAGAGCVATSAPVAVTVLPTPVATASAGGPTTFCAGGSVVLTATTPGSGLSYQWMAGTTPIGGATAASYNATTAGSYSVIVASGGCLDTSAPITITVSPVPAVSAAATGSTTVCSGSTVTLSTTASGVALQWRVGGVPIPGATGATYAAAATGSYTVTATSSAGCSATSAPIAVTIIPPPPTTVTPTGAVALCTGSVLTLAGPTGAGLSYEWRAGGVPIAGAASSTFTVSGAGSYSLRVTDGTTGCSALSATTDVTVVPLPPATISPPGPGTVCDGLTTPLTANTGPGYTYQWRYGGLPIPGATAQIYGAGTAGTYTVAVTDVAGCTDTSTGFELSVLPAPASAISYSAPLQFCEGSAVVLSAVPPAGLSTFQWNINGTPIPGATASFYAADSTGDYSLTVIDAVGCPGTSDSIPVTVLPLPMPIVVRTGNTLSTTTTYSGYQWFRNNVAIPGAAGATYTVTLTGSYGVRVVDVEGCEGRSENFFVGQIVGIAGTPNAAEALRVYPNPVRGGYLYIEAPVAVDAVLRNGIGAVVRRTDRATRLDVRGLPAGHYHLQLTDGEGRPVGSLKVTIGE